jgi:hypothetical protein
MLKFLSTGILILASAIFGLYHDVTTGTQHIAEAVLQDFGVDIVSPVASAAAAGARSASDADKRRTIRGSGRRRATI